MELVTALDNEYVTIRHSPEKKFIRNEWRGTIRRLQLREAIIFACEFILANDVELILADYTRMSAPTVEDQMWIAVHSAELLQHSNLRKVANLMAPDVFQQLAIGRIYEKASELPMPCETREFVSGNDAIEWLLSDE